MELRAFVALGCIKDCGWDAVNGGAGQLAVNQLALRRAWESSQRSTKEDWAEWMRHFSVELLKESPSPALRATYSLAQVLSNPLSFPSCMGTCYRLTHPPVA